MGKRARKASNANIDTSPKITINVLEEVGALQDVIVVGRRGVCRFLKAAGCGAKGGRLAKRSRAAGDVGSVLAM